MLEGRVAQRVGQLQRRRIDVRLAVPPPEDGPARRHPGVRQHQLPPDRWAGYSTENDWALALGDDSYDSLRYSIWAATDKAYKSP